MNRKSATEQSVPQRSPASTARAARIHPGATIAPRQLVTIQSGHIELPGRDASTHLQFRRFAGCPVCDLHLHSIVRRHHELQQAGIREVVVFHSSPRDLLPHAGDLPFAVIADPGRDLYRAFGVESSPRALLDPRAWPAILLGVSRRLAGILRGRESAPPLNPRGGRLGLPADFLIAPGGRVLACKYGTHADDQWSVDQILAAAAQDAVA